MKIQMPWPAWNEMRALIMAEDGVGIFYVSTGLEIDAGLWQRSGRVGIELLLCSGKFVLSL